jgi:hypothetical protein
LGRLSRGPDVALDDGLALRLDIALTGAEVPEVTGTEPRFPGLSHAEALAREVPPTRQLVEHLVEAGTLGTIAALPETHKSFLALELAHKIATGGKVLGAHEVLVRGPVAFWWQDDSEANEPGRIQEYAGRHDYQGELPIRWHLNESLRLPDDLNALAAEVKREEQVFVVLDSLYNFLPRLDLKDETVREVLDALKTTICDPTGATVCIVDHAPWPTEGNRGQRRAYGSVFKGAAIRWGIYLERLPDKLYIEARGNNVRGLPRTLATWDEEALELHLIDVERVTEKELDMRVLEYVADHPGEATSKVEDGVEGGRESIRESLERLATHKLLARGPGRHPNGTYWYPISDAALVPPGDTHATLGDTVPRVSQGEVSPVSPAPRRGGETSGDTLDGAVE